MSEPSLPGIASLPPTEPAAAFTHGGLADVDPWLKSAGAGPPRRGLAWPFSLDAAAEALEVVALALLMFIAVRAVAQNFVVDGASMQPSFHNGELVIVNKLAYRSFDISWLPWTDETDWRPFGDPQPGDVVVFRFPQDPDRDFIKRVVAVPGQTVEVSDGHVLVDGVPVEESYLEEAPRYRYGPEMVPPDQVFVLGDNRNNSYDSHSWGVLDRSAIIGRADLRYWPLDRIGIVHDGGPVQLLVTEVSTAP